MDKKIKYHIFSFNEKIRFVLAETSPDKYFWLSVYLKKNLRNQFLSKEISIYIISLLQGTHEIHWQIGLKTFDELAKKYKWVIRKESQIFENCKFTIIKKVHYNSNLSPLLNIILSHKILSKCPILTNYQSREDQQIVLKLIISG